jgi:hypothetical protein
MTELIEVTKRWYNPEHQGRIFGFQQEFSERSFKFN